MQPKCALCTWCDNTADKRDREVFSSNPHLRTPEMLKKNQKGPVHERVAAAVLALKGQPMTVLR